jgi:hypothetical protein
LQSDAEKLYRRLAHLKLNSHAPQRFGRDGFLGIFGRKVDLLGHYEKKLEDAEDNVRLEQSSLAGKVCYSCIYIIQADNLIMNRIICCEQCFPYGSYF